MKKKILVGMIIIALFMITLGNTTIFADDNSDWSSRDFWKDANDWYSQGTIEDVTTWGSIKAILDKFSNMVEVVGTTVIVCVTTFLGIKYMYGSAQGKAEVKDSLVTLLVACVFFFGWNGIWGLLFQNGSLTINPSGTDFNGIVGNIFQILSFIASILAVGAVIYIGIRYIFAGATGKSELKGKSVQFLIGFILAFCSVTLLHYVSSVINQALAK